MFRLYYDHEASGDVMFVLIDPEAPVDEMRKGRRAAALYSKGRLVGYNIFNVSKTVKIRSKGMIAAPKEELLMAVNAILSGGGFEPLPEPTSSGYLEARILNLEEHPVDEEAKIVSLSLGEKTAQTVSRYPNLRIGECVVVETDGCLTYDGSAFHPFTSRNIRSDVSICSARELCLGDDNRSAFVIEDGKEGRDFFLGTE